jgi:hypothetical protein
MKNKNITQQDIYDIRMLAFIDAMIAVLQEGLITIGHAAALDAANAIYRLSEQERVRLEESK